MEDNDAPLQLKKRARRRLVGAIFFVSLVAVLLPMVMDHEPRQPVQDVEIRIPGQDEKPFAPKFAAPPVEKPAEKAVEAPLPPEKVAEVEAKPSPEPVVKAVGESKVVAKPVDKPAPKPEKPVEKPAAKPAEKPADKTAGKARTDDARRAAALLSGQTADTKPSAKSGEYLVLIGAFSNEANVKGLKAKLAEQGIKTFTEPLDTPQGKKTRVRAGPFASREAAERALEKMQRVGVGGVVAAKP